MVGKTQPGLGLEEPCAAQRPLAGRGPATPRPPSANSDVQDQDHVVEG